jgi:hypothetical protein
MLILIGNTVWHMACGYMRFGRLTMGLLIIEEDVGTIGFQKRPLVKPTMK